MNRVVEYAPAKVNLYLKILGKRPDGYHEIETLFERINIRDKVVISGLKSGITVTCRNGRVPCGKKNLCYASAKLVKERFKIDKGVKVDIIKKIPVAAGLGGGSSDAASVLKGLNRLWGLGLSRNELVNLAGSVGSDTAFFVSDSRFSIGRGRGERLEPVESGVSLWHLIITPDIEMLAKDVYRLYSRGNEPLPLTRKAGIGKILPPNIYIGNMGQINALLHNDLEDVVLRQKPIIRKIKDALVANGAKKAIVSGSGPSVFGLFESRKEAFGAGRLWKRRLSMSRKWRAFVAETC